MPRETKIWIGLGLLVVLGLLLYLLSPILTPFLLSAALAYLGDPLVDRIELWLPRLSRTGAVVIVFLAIFLILTILVLFWLPLLIRQINTLIANLPAFLDWLQTSVLPRLQSYWGVDPTLFEFSRLRATLTGHLDTLGDMAGTVLSSLGKSSLTIIAWLVQLLLIPVVTFYLLRDWDILVARIQSLLPRRIEPVVSRLARESDAVLGAFLLGQFMVMLILSAVYSIGLLAVGVNFALVIGVLSGLLSFVPYLGLIVGLAAASIATLIQFQDLLHLLLVWAVFGIGQLLEGWVLTPRLVGERIGLHPVAVIFAVLAGGHLFGFLGVLLALPTAAVIMVLLRHTHDEYLRSVWYDG